MYLDTFCFVMHCDIKDTKKWALFEAFFLLAVTFPQDTFVGPVAALLFMEFIYNTNTNTYLQYTIINCSLCIENTCMYSGDQIKSNYTVYNTRGNTVYNTKIAYCSLCI